MTRNIVNTTMDARAFAGAFAALDEDMTLAEAECLMSFDAKVRDAIDRGDQWALTAALQDAADEMLYSGAIGGAL